MPRWHVMVAGACPGRLWPKDRDRFVFLAELRGALRREGAGCLGYCLLGGSGHLVLEAPGAEPLRRAVEHACSGYGRYWRGWYAWGRRVFRPARAAAVPEELLWDLLAHVETAPVRAGLAAAAEDYRWSSAAAHAGWGQSYLPVEMEAWEACWSCARWRGHLAGWGMDLRRMKAVARLLEGARPLRVLAAPAAEPSPGPLLLPAIRAARAAGGWA